ncbi:LINE-1 retrotransposable element ORF2 protein [Chionoecetes opilio]|uniref:LINE-1 retrotransposable element ORF2 protein n=1 Tax=Chionoecetes opilio TaxID=41210 RepID=A0A8J5CKD9_CHIOP|nr:LINE-1 retrotransposable element ORF2 protein [Chionoecetes opilio]
MPSDASEESMSLLERFVVLMYDRTSDTMEVNDARKQLFAHKSRALENIPPTQAALQQHIKRASLQGNCWNQTLVLNPELPIPSDWGWTKEASGWQPLWTTLPSAKSCHELIHCGCKKGCTGRCKCTKAALNAELLKAGGEAMIRGLHAVLTAVWQSGTIPPDWKRGLVIPIWKGKGDRQDCNNYRGITLLSIPGKVLAHLLLTRIRSHLVKHQRPQQSGFTPGKSTTDRILALHVLMERRREFRQGMLAAYVDLKKAFDSVHRESLWDLLRLRGILARTIGLITGLYSGTESAVKCRAGVSSFFPVNTGVRQGCVLAPSLFNSCIDWVLDKVVNQSDCGASVGNTKITDLVFADDAVIFAESLEVLVMALEALHEEAKPLGLEVSWLKTKVQVFGDLLDEAVQSVHACGEDIEILESFTYLGSAVHNDGGSRQEVLRRIGIAHGVMDSLSGSIWRCRYPCRRTKIRIFKSLVIPVLLYGCETWTLNSDLKRRINAFGPSCGYSTPPMHPPLRHTAQRASPRHTTVSGSLGYSVCSQDRPGGVCASVRQTALLRARVLNLLGQAQPTAAPPLPGCSLLLHHRPAVVSPPVVVTSFPSTACTGLCYQSPGCVLHPQVDD